MSQPLRCTISLSDSFLAWPLMLPCAEYIVPCMEAAGQGIVTPECTKVVSIRGRKERIAAFEMLSDATYNRVCVYLFGKVDTRLVDASSE